MSRNNDDDKYEVLDENSLEFKLSYPKGRGFEWDLTPVIDWNVIYRIKVPEDRWFTDEEFRKIFVRAYKLSKKNVEDMIQWDKEHHYPSRFEPHHNGLSDRENRIKAICDSDNDPVIEENWFNYFTGKISTIELMEKNLNRILYNNREAGRKRYKATPELLKEREDGIKKLIKKLP